MSRGEKVRKEDEECALYAVGEAINQLAIQRYHSDLAIYENMTYERARDCATEAVALALRDLVKESPYWR